jgi:glycogen phosphorylase
MQTYSGGLGVLAGDHLKAASDLGLDLVGVGLLYRHGYFRQLLDANGWQQERYPDLNPYNLPLRRLEFDGRDVPYYESGLEPWASTGYGALRSNLVERVITAS